MSRLNNTYQAIGNLGDDPRSGTFDNGNAWASCRVAINDGYYDKQNQWVSRAVWVEIKFFGKLAERMTVQLSKGDTLMFSGKLQQSDWTDKQGNKRTDLYVLADQAKKLELIRKSEIADAVKPVPAPQTQPATNNPVPADDLPF